MRVGTDKTSVVRLYHLIQLCDSALPVGGFSFSCALESAVAQGFLCDVATLESYVRTVVRQTLFSDGVAALYAMRHWRDEAALLYADRELFLRKSSREMRTMSCRMGRKLAELGSKLELGDEVERWLTLVANGHTFGQYAITQGLIFARCGALEQELFSSVGYGTAAMVTGAALRLMRVTHLDTQQVLFALAPLVDGIYDEVKGLGLDQMQGFAPLMEIFSSQHEKGKQRMFMS